jgi:hypothetical protein
MPRCLRVAIDLQSSPDLNFNALDRFHQQRFRLDGHDASTQDLKGATPAR